VTVDDTSEFDREMSDVSARLKGAGPRTSSDKTAFFSKTEIGETVFAVSKADPSQVVNTFAALLNHSDEGGYSLGFARYAPNTVIPRHRHDCDQVVLVLEGSMSQGNRVLGPGCGYYTPAGRAYALAVGSEGCCYVEFRHRRLDDVGTEMLVQWPEDYQWLA
jgi:hypothetical protein